jgi:hypothetical protein
VGAAEDREELEEEEGVEDDEEKKMVAAEEDNCMDDTLEEGRRVTKKDELEDERGRIMGAETKEIDEEELEDSCGAANCGEAEEGIEEELEDEGARRIGAAVRGLNELTELEDTTAAIHWMQGSADVVWQVCPVLAQKLVPPLAHSLPAQTGAGAAGA